MSEDSHYTKNAGAEYFSQRTHCRSSYAQRDSAQLLIPYLKGHDTVLDFGCGTGGIISLIPCNKRIGIEINESASAEASSKGIEMHTDIRNVADNSVDAAMTHHAIEHVVEPFSILKEVHRVLKPGGKFVVVVPAEEPRAAGCKDWQENIEQHLYSWNPRTMGNLLVVAGFNLEDAYVADGGASRYLAPLEKMGPLHKGAKVIYAWARSRWQTVCVAQKPAS